LSIEHIIVLAIVQGLTEFLPVSSSGHLILIPALTDWPDQGQVTDVMVHIGSLFAVIVYFSGTGDLIRGVKIVAWNAVIFGVLLWVADVIGKRTKVMEDLTLPPALIIGFAQALALIPGTSRSGITMTAARLLGFERAEAARFSFLLGIPAIAAAGAFISIDVIRSGQSIPPGAILAAVLTFFAALGAIALLMALVKRIGFFVFMLYRLGLAAVLFALIYGWIPGVTLSA